MRIISKRIGKALTCTALAFVLMMIAFLLSPQLAFADDGQEQAPNIKNVWVVPEVISGARQPAKNGMFAWVTFDYRFEGDNLASAIDSSDFILQRKVMDGDWETVSSSIAVIGGDEYYIASFEAIVATRVPDNEDPFIKKWRLVYKPEDAEKRIESEVIVQAANLPYTDDVTAFNKDYCVDFDVQEVPWNYEQYQNDKIPPIYVAYVYPEVDSSLKDNGLETTNNHKIVMPWTGTAFDFKNGTTLGPDIFSMTDTDISLGAEDEEGIAGLTTYWKELQDSSMWPGGDIPDAEELQNKIASVVCVPDENADEYLSYVVDGTNVFWVSGAGTQERKELGVTDYILVLVRDFEALGDVKHDWSEQAVWEWIGSDETEYSGATATFTCGNHKGHVNKIRAFVRSTDDGNETTYTASAVFDGKIYRDVKVVKNAEEEDYVPPTLNQKQGTDSNVKKPSKTSVIKASTVNAAVIKKAIAASGGNPSTIVLASNVKRISKNAFKGTKVKTLVVKSKKLKKKSVKGSLKGSKIKTVKVKVGNKKTNKKYVKKYKKFFTKKNAGKKVTVK